MSSQTKEIHCEKTGQVSSLDDTVVLTKINGIIVSKNCNNPKIDMDKKSVYSSTSPPHKFYSEINVPNELKPIFGRIFAIVDDEDELEQSTAILSTKGKNLFTIEQLMPFMEYIDQTEILRLPDSMFIAIIDENASNKYLNCENWNLSFKSIGRKYRSKRILEEKHLKIPFGVPEEDALKKFDIEVSDWNQKNPNGTSYLFKTDNKFQNINLCSNESAVDYCINNKCLVYYNDFLNKGKLRVLTPYTENINKKLQNPYLFRSSNIS